MKKIYAIAIVGLCILAVHIQGQTITLSFMGQDSGTQIYLPLDSVIIQNATLGCDTVIYGDPPSIVLTNTLGINDPQNPGSESFIVRPPVPNPFNGSTIVQIIMIQPGKLRLALTDSKGILLSETEKDCPAGMHRFEIRSATKNMMVLKITDGSYVKSVKLINNGDGTGENQIAYLGTGSTVDKAGHTEGGFKFWTGNQLIYKSAKTGYFEAVIGDSPTQNTIYTFQLIQQISAPTVTTDSITGIGQTFATGGGEVISSGSESVSDRGVCWGTTPNPTISGYHTHDGAGTGPFVSTMNDLYPDRVYYVRAYAINNVGTAYGDQMDFMTLPAGSDPCAGITTVDYEGKTYNTIGIGDQCWLKENLDVGTRVDATTGQTDNGIIEKFCYNNLSSNCDTYGGLYQWEEVMNYGLTEGSQGICPEGWHIPTDEEYCVLTTYLDESVNCSVIGVSGTIAGTKMKSTTGWYMGGNGTDESGFTGLPTGSYLEGYDHIDQGTSFWTSTSQSGTLAYYWGLYFNTSGVNRFSIELDWNGAVSVRCIKD